MLALIVAKASSSGTGVGLHVIIMRPCCGRAGSVSRFGGFINRKHDVLQRSR